MVLNMNEKLIEAVNNKNATFKMVDENGNETIMNNFELIEMLIDNNKSLEKHIYQLQEQNTILENKINKARELLKKELYNPLESIYHYDIERLEKDLLDILGDDEND